MKDHGNKRKNGDGDYEILMVSVDLHKTGFGRRRRAKNLMLAVCVFTLWSNAPIWMGYSHVCISLHGQEPSNAWWCPVKFHRCRASFVLLANNMCRVTRVCFDFPKKTTMNVEQAPAIRSFFNWTLVRQCLSAEETSRLHYHITSEVVEVFIHLFTEWFIIYRHRHHRRQRWWWWWRRWWVWRRSMKMTVFVMLFLQCIIIIT